jgi:2-oxo-4-hydroxy-4-carboxy-5-ureidoimidazoline decarboxylase
MTQVLAHWNGLSLEKAMEEILPCCGSKAWAHGMAMRRPIKDETALLAAGDESWNSLQQSDWLEAFNSHPRIGEAGPATTCAAKAVAWSSDEQKSVGTAADHLKLALAEGNRAYEERFRRIFIVCANGKSPEEILAILKGRLRNDDCTELLEAAEQQRQITQLRLKKWAAQ